MFYLLMSLMMKKNLQKNYKIIYLGNDHGGVNLRDAVYRAAKIMGYQVVDLGVLSAEESVDYPHYVKKVVDSLIQDQSQENLESYGILLCGTGIGMSIAANRFPQIRAALCHTKFEARVAKEHNNANALCFGGRVLTLETVEALIVTFLSCSFEGGRHQRRLDQINSLCGFDG